MRSLIMSKRRDLRMVVIGENLGVLTPCKTILNLLNAIYLRLRKTVVELQ